MQNPSEPSTAISNVKLESLLQAQFQEQVQSKHKSGSMDQNQWPQAYPSCIVVT